MGDRRRFDLFAQLIERRWPERGLRIADVAGGQGGLRAALHQRGYRQVVTFDKRKGRAHRPGYRYGWFDADARGEFDLLVGMHPDEATDVIIVTAWRRGLPFAVVPCCALPTLIPYRGAQAGLQPWFRHLAREARKLGFEVEESSLPMSGANLVLVGRPNRRSGLTATPREGRLKVAPGGGAAGGRIGSSGRESMKLQIRFHQVQE